MSSKTIVFIDAENVSVKEFEEKRKKQIKKAAKKYGLDINEIEYRAYGVEGAPTSHTWKSDGVRMISIPGQPAKDKADDQIAKELWDQAGKEHTCFLVTHDQGLISRVGKELTGVIVVDDKQVTVQGARA